MHACIAPYTPLSVSCLGKCHVLKRAAPRSGRQVRCRAPAALSFAPRLHDPPRAPGKTCMSSQATATATATATALQGGSTVLTHNADDVDHREFTVGGWNRFRGVCVRSSVHTAHTGACLNHGINHCLHFCRRGGDSDQGLREHTLELGCIITLASKLNCYPARGAAGGPTPPANSCQLRRSYTVHKRKGSRTEIDHMLRVRRCFGLGLGFVRWPLAAILWEGRV
jgi:hypothetical protein